MGFREADAFALDQQWPSQRHRFLIPPDTSPSSCSEVAYLAGNSLGLQPAETRSELLTELDDWAELGVEGHVEAHRPWFSYHELLRDDAASIVGATPREVVMMNSLTVNIHLLMASFYRPTTQRYKILIEDHAFSSDSYAVRSHAAFRGFDPNEAIVRATPRAGEHCLRTDDVIALLDSDDIALVLLGGVGYLTGELLDIPAITSAAHARAIPIGWDLAHAAGNVPLELHNWNVDFAAWCTYKYLNSGPGAVAGAFVHEQHLDRRDIPRLEGWWSTRASDRFDMNPISQPPDSVDAWAISNPPILAMSPVRTSLAMFAEIGMPALRERSIELTGFLESMLLEMGADIITPRDPNARGSQLSIQVSDSTATSKRLRSDHGVIADARRPNIIRLAPTAMYSTFHDCWRAANAMSSEV